MRMVYPYYISTRRRSASHFRKIQQWLKDSAQKDGLSLMKLAPNSPDINPIVNLLAHLEREVHRRYPDTASLRGSQDRIKRVLKAGLMEG